jgi:hypothetical protein
MLWGLHVSITVLTCNRERKNVSFGQENKVNELRSPKLEAGTTLEELRIS